jgi:hypothetical protein
VTQINPRLIYCLQFYFKGDFVMGKKMSAKQLELLAKEQEEFNMRKNTKECADYILQRMVLDVDKYGYIMRYDEENNELSYFTFGGKKCKYLEAYIDQRNEMVFDPYNNVKLSNGLLQYYLNDYMEKEVVMIFLSNRNMNEPGNTTILFTDGTKVSGHEYNKDSLKYLDMILVLDQGLKPDFSTLKGMDIECQSN